MEPKSTSIIACTEELARLNKALIEEKLKTQRLEGHLSDVEKARDSWMAKANEVQRACERLRQKVESLTESHTEASAGRALLATRVDELSLSESRAQCALAEAHRTMEYIRTIIGATAVLRGCGIVLDTAQYTRLLSEIRTEIERATPRNADRSNT